MPPVVGVLLLVLAWGIFELVVWLGRRRASRKPPALAPASPDASTKNGEARAQLPVARAARPRSRSACVVLVHGF